MNEHDTYFKEFARLLWSEILQSPEMGDVLGYRAFSREQADAIEHLIARRVGDLVRIENFRRDIARMFNLPLPVPCEASDSARKMERCEEKPLEE